MKNDLISRSELRKKLQARHNNGNDNFDKGYNVGIETAIELLDNVPTVEPEEVYLNGKDYNLYLEGYKQGKKDFERPQGEWVEVPVKRDLLYYNGIKYTCSVCGNGNCYGKPPYCMYCGADMRKGEEE